jgi:putative tricarboxylic transport membrane protein
MRKADIITAALIIVWCIISMIEATKLKIGWVRNVGPGGGFLPFWLCFLIGIFALIVLLQLIMTKEPSTEPFFKDRAGFLAVMKVLGTAAGAVVLYTFIGAYFGSMVYIAFYMLYVGKRSKLQTAIVSIMVPFGIWLMFEYMLKIPLPKGIEALDELWYRFIPL